MTLAAASLLVLGACGDDDDDDSAGGADSEYCQLAAELDQQEEFPGEDQLNELIDAAPEEIADDVEFVSNAFIEAGEENIGEVFNDPEVNERLVSIEAYESDVCGIGGDEEEDGTSSEIDPDAQRVDVSATEYDFEFEAPDAGPVSFVMSNDGEEAHFMLIVKLADGVTMDEALEADGDEGTTEAEYDSDTVGPGQEAVLTVDDLEAGEYAMLCFIPAPDGVPHTDKGMAVPFTVG